MNDSIDTFYLLGRKSGKVTVAAWAKLRWFAQTESSRVPAVQHFPISPS
jgi:hypothetical protein